MLQDVRRYWLARSVVSTQVMFARSFAVNGMPVFAIAKKLQALVLGK